MKHIKSFRSSLLESNQKPGKVWKTVSGWASKNKEGSVEYFENENQAMDWAKGHARMRPEGSQDTCKHDTSCPVELDDDGNDAKPKPKAKPKAKKTVKEGMQFREVREEGNLALVGMFLVSMNGELKEEKIVIDLPEYSFEDITEYLNDNEVEYTTDKNGIIWITDPVEQAEISISENIEESFSISIDEAAAKKKIVVRKGKKKILFMCAPGMMKRGPRQCVRRNATSLRKLKFRSKRSARKSRSKRGQSNRKRRVSVRKRLSFGIRPRKAKK